MKTIFGLFVAGMIVDGAAGQGTLVFANTGVNGQGQSWSAPIFNQGGVTPLGSSYEVALYASLSSSGVGSPYTSNLDPTSTTPISGSGLYTGPIVTFAAVAPGDHVFIAVAVWQAAYGSTLQQAVVNGSLWGYSAPFGVYLGSASAPASLDGMPSFSLMSPIPEPGTVALFCLGALSLSVPFRDTRR
jgi:hypothetical protein